jgi:3-deoxy-D-manno-octulosonate 8-phosphate phosphatase (KDO 8-P phosphatase)
MADHRSSDEELESLLASVRLAVFDFDGVFTDNTVYVDQDGRESVRCWRSDGLGLTNLKNCGVAAMIISTEVNPVVTARAQKLGLPVVQGCARKLDDLIVALEMSQVTAREALFVGNDINDGECLRHVGIPIVVADAHPDVLPIARFVTRAPGGRGAVREVCDMIVAAKSRRA